MYIRLWHVQTTTCPNRTPQPSVHSKQSTVSWAPWSMPCLWWLLRLAGFLWLWWLSACGTRWWWHRQRNEKRRSRFRWPSDRIKKVVFILWLRLQTCQNRLHRLLLRGPDLTWKNIEIQSRSDFRMLAAEISHTLQLCQSCQGGDWQFNHVC